MLLLTSQSAVCGLSFSIGEKRLLSTKKKRRTNLSCEDKQDLHVPNLPRKMQNSEDWVSFETGYIKSCIPNAKTCDKYLYNAIIDMIQLV